MKLVVLLGDRLLLDDLRHVHDLLLGLRDRLLLDDHRLVHDLLLGLRDSGDDLLHLHDLLRGSLSLEECDDPERNIRHGREKVKMRQSCDGGVRTRNGNRQNIKYNQNPKAVIIFNSSS